MKLRAALKKHQESRASNAGTMPPIHVIQLWSYRVGTWQVSYEVATLDPTSSESTWHRTCESLDAVERYMEKAFEQETGQSYDPDAWS